MANGELVDLSLQRFAATSPAARVVLGRHNGNDVSFPYDFNKFTFLRGTVDGKAGSDVFLALSDGLSTGHIAPVPGGPVFRVSSKDQFDAALPAGQISVFSSARPSGAVSSSMPNVPMCGMNHAEFSEDEEIDGRIGYCSGRRNLSAVYTPN